MGVVVGPGDSHPASSGQKLPREGALARPAWRGLALGLGRPSSDPPLAHGWLCDLRPLACLSELLLHL